jgi:hypothetical protein
VGKSAFYGCEKIKAINAPLMNVIDFSCEKNC